MADFFAAARSSLSCSTRVSREGCRVTVARARREVVRAVASSSPAPGAPETELADRVILSCVQESVRRAQRGQARNRSELQRGSQKPRRRCLQRESERGGKRASRPQDNVCATTQRRSDSNRETASATKTSPFTTQTRAKAFSHLVSLANAKG